MTKNNRSTPVIVSENGQGRYQQTIRIGQHTLIADEPVAAGGGDVGPDPFEYLLAALGACTSMTLRMYANLKKLSLTGIHVELTHRKVDVEGQGKVDRIERGITLTGELTDAQRIRMLEIANKCPVHRTLCSNIQIESTLLESRGV